jgi:hypothetical protein
LNESLTSCYLYLLLSLTDFNGFNPLRDELALVLLSVVLLVVMGNLGKAWYVDGKAMIRAVKRWWWMKRKKTISGDAVAKKY